MLLVVFGQWKVVVLLYIVYLYAKNTSSEKISYKQNPITISHIEDYEYIRNQVLELQNLYSKDEFLNSNKTYYIDEFDKLNKHIINNTMTPKHARTEQVKIINQLLYVNNITPVEYRKWVFIKDFLLKML